MLVWLITIPLVRRSAYLSFFNSNCLNWFEESWCFLTKWLLLFRRLLRSILLLLLSESPLVLFKHLLSLILFLNRLLSSHRERMRILLLILISRWLLLLLSIQLLLILLSIIVNILPLLLKNYSISFLIHTLLSTS